MSQPEEDGSDIIGALSEDEHTAIKMTADLWNHLVQKVVGGEATREQDLSELCIHIHAIQHAIMGQAAARAHPELYRFLGGQLK